MKEGGDDPMDEDDRIEEAAMAWLIERDEGFVPGREEEFGHWRRSDPRHAEAVERLEETWNLLQEMPPLAAHGSQRRGQPVPTVSWHWKPLWGAVAAAAVLVLAVVWMRRDERSFDGVYATAAGVLENVELPDGSRVTFNASSSARVQYTPAARHVVLEEGEAHFRVAHDEKRPFFVTAGGVEVRAVGTAFNVRLAGAAIEVVVTSGKVRLATPEHAADAAEGEPATPLLEKGDRAVVQRGTVEVAPVVTRLAPEELQEAVAWQDEMLVFSETPLREVVAQFNRYNQIQLHLGDVELGARRVGGVFSARNVEALVDLLEQGGDLTVERRSDRDIILHRAR